ncbi:MAG: hypothetical protein AABY13_06030, partial [Nanoarchaeota archaeon]
LRKVFYTAYDLGVRSYAGLAQVAGSSLQPRILGMQKYVKDPELLAEAVVKASVRTQQRFNRLKFTCRSMESLLRYNLPNIFVNQLDVEKSMLKAMVRDDVCDHERYALNLANCFAHSAFAADGDEAFFAAEELFENARLGEAEPGWDDHTMEELESLVRVVDANRFALDGIHQGWRPSED